MDGNVQRGQSPLKVYLATVSTGIQKTGTVYRKVRTVHCQNVTERVEDLQPHHLRDEKWCSDLKSTVPYID